MLENDFLKQLAERFPARPPVITGIGDDGAVLQIPPDGRLTVVTDMLLDGVHFRLDQIDPALAGRKSVAVNLSDLAAMAATPVAAFVSIAVPKGQTRANPGWIERVYDGIEELARQYHFTIAGGDTNSWEGPFAINVCLLGRPMSGHFPLRSAAVTGDLICVSGPLGGSLHHGRHLRFTPRFDAAHWLTSYVRLHALMDISDGLAADLPRMLAASRKGGILFADQIPIHPDVPAALSEADRLHAALNDGEDFELLFTIPAEDQVLLSNAGAELQFAVVGRVVDEPAIQMVSPDGRIEPVLPGGWQHRL
jgi:thiamine-monophosphate kinase